MTATSTTNTLFGPRTARPGPAFWAGLALCVGGAVGASVGAVVSDSDDAASQVSTSVDASFRSASAAEAQRYVDMLEDRASGGSQAAVTEHGYYAHGYSYAPETSSRVSADATEHRALAEAVVVTLAHPSADAAEHLALAE